ncbi:hypothetical protein CHELA20_53392 [Hyphomicrobiales bacterium]|nr:hypothetical protein CHELA20_53392 [Hyphomicrobiales bacterium]
MPSFPTRESVQPSDAGDLMRLDPNGRFAPIPVVTAVTGATQKRASIQARGMALLRHNRTFRSNLEPDIQS